MMRSIVSAALCGVAVLGVALLAACSGSGPSPNSDNSAGPTSSGSGVAYSSCMRSHGIARFPDPAAGGQLPKGSAAQFEVSAPQYQAAQRACQYLVTINGETSEQQQETQCAMADDCSQSVVAQWMDGLHKLAHCLRTHGYPTWPDPIISTQQPNLGLPHFPYEQAGIDHHAQPVLDKVQVCVGLIGFEGLPLP